MKISKNDDFDCKDVIFERKLDGCKLSEIVMNSMYFSVLFKDFLRAANFEIKCPYKAGLYTVTNFTTLSVPRMPFPSNVCNLDWLIYSNKSHLFLFQTGPHVSDPEVSRENKTVAIVWTFWHIYCFFKLQKLSFLLMNKKFFHWVPKKVNLK